MNILKVSTPQKNEIELTTGKWVMPYYVGTFVELEEELIVCYDWDEIKANPPYKGFYHGCTVWCYNKKDKSIKWIIEEPPTVYDSNGKDLGKIRGFSSHFKDMPIDECYMGISGEPGYDLLFTHTTGARAFRVNPDNGKVTLTATGLK
jgi:hypothetical protein